MTLTFLFNTTHYNIKKQHKATDNEIHKLNIPRGGEFFVCLSDGTKVWLNSESELKYASEFVGEERRVYLTGEAYFEVAHNPNKPFFVEAKNLQIQVLGTSFGVRVYKDEVMPSQLWKKGRSISIQQLHL